MKDIDETKQPLFDHLVELRRRLLISLAALVAAFMLCLYFAKPIFGLLVQPLLAAGQGKLIYTDVFEGLLHRGQSGAVRGADAVLSGIRDAGLAVRRAGTLRQGEESLPAIPGDDALLLRRGRAVRLFRGDALGAEVPVELRGQCRGRAAGSLARVGNYLSFVTRFLFGFGVAFLTPVLLMILERAGIVTREQLAAKRRHAIVACAAVSAVLTPPDAVSMLLLLVPLYALYEFAILAIRITHWRAARRDANDAGRKAGPKSSPGGGRVDDFGPV